MAFISVVMTIMYGVVSFMYVKEGNAALAAVWAGGAGCWFGAFVVSIIRGQ